MNAQTTLVSKLIHFNISQKHKMHICVDFCFPFCLIFQSTQAQQATLTPLVTSLITYISVAIFYIPRNVSCYVSTTSWAEFAGKKNSYFIKLH